MYGEIPYMEVSRVGALPRSAWGLQNGNSSATQDIVCAHINMGYHDNHSIGYCLIGYMCAWLRYYHPLEFATSFLNNAMNDEDLANGVGMCAAYKIKMTPPRFGLSKDNYVFDRDQRVIAMGVSSIKFLNKKPALQLYDLGKRHKYDCFVDLLADIDQKTVVDTRQRDILIKIDYFADFGEMAALQKITEAFDFFKAGRSKSVRKESECPYIEYVKQYATDMNKDGSILKTYTIQDCMGMLRHIERDILGSANEPVSYTQKIKWQLEYLNSVQPSNNPDDRWTVYVKSIKPVCRKKDGKQFGWNVITVSLGSGKETMATIFTKSFIPGTKEGSVLKTKPSWWSRSGKYFNLDKYELME
jgi:DNA polymerase III subunit alpha